MEKQDDTWTRSKPEDNNHSQNAWDISTIKALRLVQAQFYSMCVSHGLVERAQPFLEFCSLMNKYIDLIERAVVAGIDPCSIDGHTELPIEPHDMAYLGDKLKRVFGPIVVGNPMAKLTLYNTLFEPGTR